MLDTGVFQQLTRCIPVILVNHHASRQNAERAFHDAHVLVGDEKGNAGVAQETFNEGDDHGIIGADEFYHGRDVDSLRHPCKRLRD